jgi:hypothetical protein
VWQVLYELLPKTAFGFLTEGMRNTWPLNKLVGDAPNFEYADPATPGKKKHKLLRVQAANEPGDYVWRHLTMREASRLVYRATAHTARPPSHAMRCSMDALTALPLGTG